MRARPFALVALLHAALLSSPLSAARITPLLVTGETAPYGGGALGIEYVGEHVALDDGSYLVELDLSGDVTAWYRLADGQLELLVADGDALGSGHNAALRYNVQRTYPGGLIVEARDTPSGEVTAVFRFADGAVEQVISDDTPCPDGVPETYVDNIELGPIASDGTLYFLRPCGDLQLLRAEPGSAPAVVLGSPSPAPGVTSNDPDYLASFGLYAVTSAQPGRAYLSGGFSCWHIEDEYFGSDLDCLDTSPVEGIYELSGGGLTLVSLRGDPLAGYTHPDPGYLTEVRANANGDLLAFGEADPTVEVGPDFVAYRLSGESGFTVVAQVGDPVPGMEETIRYLRAPIGIDEEEREHARGFIDAQGRVTFVARVDTYTTGRGCVLRASGAGALEVVACDGSEIGAPAPGWLVSAAFPPDVLSASPAGRLFALWGTRQGDHFRTALLAGNADGEPEVIAYSGFLLDVAGESFALGKRDSESYLGDFDVNYSFYPGGQGDGGSTHLSDDGKALLVASDGYAHSRSALFLVEADVPWEVSDALVVNSTGDEADAVAGDRICNTGATLAATGAIECTLRAAIQEANASGAFARIDFDIAASTPAGISVTSALPPITVPLVIDGTTQDESASGPAVRLRGFGAGDDVHGLVVESDGVELRGLILERFEGDGVHFTPADGVLRLEDVHVLYGCGYGLFARGSVYAGSASRGFRVEGPSGAFCEGGGVLHTPSESGHVLTLENVDLVDNAGPGVVSTATVVVRGARISGNGGPGIAVLLGGPDSDRRVSIEPPGAEIAANLGDGVSLEGAGFETTGSVSVVDNGGWGIWADPGLVRFGDIVNLAPPSTVARNGTLVSGCLDVVLDGETAYTFDVACGGGGVFTSATDGNASNVFTSVDVMDNGAAGIMAQTANQLARVNVTGNAAEGVLVVQEDTVVPTSRNMVDVVLESSLSANGGDGVRVEAGSVLFTGPTTVDDNGGAGVWLEAGSLQIGSAQAAPPERHSVSGNTGAGVLVEAGDVQAHDVDVSHNGGDGVSASGDVSLMRARVCGNGGEAVTGGSVSLLEVDLTCDEEEEDDAGTPNPPPDGGQGGDNDAGPGDLPDGSAAGDGGPSGHDAGPHDDDDDTGGADAGAPEDEEMGCAATGVSGRGVSLPLALLALLFVGLARPRRRR